jgi:hypothetical protein
VRKNRSFDGRPTGTVVSTFLTPSVSPKFCVRRNDENGEDFSVEPVATVVVSLTIMAAFRYAQWRC